MHKAEIFHPDKNADTGAYSAGVVMAGWLYISGQGPLDLKTGEVVAGTIEEETLLTLSHIKKIIEEAGSSIDRIVKCTVHLSHIEDFGRFNEVYKSFFKDIAVMPARTTVGSVLSDGIKVEIDAVAFVGNTSL